MISGPWFRRSRVGLTLALFAPAALLAVGAGAWAMRAAGEPAGLWSRNLAAWMVGLVALLLIRRGKPAPGLRRGLLLAALAALGASLVTRGEQGVHRWLAVGPVRLNAAAFVLPALLVLLGREPERAWRIGLAAAAGSLLALQPDASQAVALALGCLVLGLQRSEATPAARIGMIVPAALGAVVALLRPDPLQPVPHVEGIVPLAASCSGLVAGLLVLGLAGAVLAPLRQRGSLPLVVYLAAVALAPAWGAFPVPLAGYGLSFVLGQFLGVALLLQDSGPEAGGQVR